MTGSGSGEKFGGVGTALFGEVAAEHAGDFIDSLLFNQKAGLHPGGLIFGCFLHLELFISADGDLGQVGDTEGLAGNRQASQ